MAPLFKPKSKANMDDAPESSGPKSLAMAVGIRAKKRKMAKASPHSEHSDADDSQDMVQSIMRKRKMAGGGLVDSDKMQDSMGLEMDKMSDGGMVDLDHNGDESENMFDELSEDALKENYDDAPVKGESMVDSIRRKVMAKRSE